MCLGTRVTRPTRDKRAGVGPTLTAVRASRDILMSASVATEKPYNLAWTLQVLLFLVQSAFIQATTGKSLTCKI
jgi:hypothetical protein